MKWSNTLSIFVSVVAVAALLTPEPIVTQLKAGAGADRSAATNGGAAIPPGSPLLAALRLVHLSAFSGAFGASLWVTFVGGIIMFRNLPRHQFGNLQSKMFPAYFTLVAMASAVCVGAFALLNPWGTASPGERWQLAALGTTLVGTLLNLLVLEPRTTKVMRDRHKVEREAGLGSEIGGAKNREVAKTNDALRALNKRFGMLHGMSSLANLVALGGIGVHLWYLACHLAL